MKKSTEQILGVGILGAIYIFFTRSFEESLASSESALFIVCALGVLLVLGWLVKEFIKGVRETIRLITRSNKK